MNASDEILFRPATVQDTSIIAKHRRAMFRDMGYQDENAMSTMEARFREWLKPKLISGEYLAWLAFTASQSVVAGAGLWLMDWPPHMLGSSTRRGNILNVYTEPEFRRRGLARRLMEEALRWSKGNRIDLVILHASKEGRSLYESLGFQTSNEMRIKL